MFSMLQQIQLTDDDWVKTGCFWCGVTNGCSPLGSFQENIFSVEFAVLSRPDGNRAISTRPIRYVLNTPPGRVLHSYTSSPQSQGKQQPAAPLCNNNSPWRVLKMGNPIWGFLELKQNPFLKFQNFPYKKVTLSLGILCSSPRATSRFSIK